MATTKQRATARKNVKKAQSARSKASSSSRSRAKASRAKSTASSSARSSRRAAPGAKGGGGYYHVEVMPRSQFKIFRTQDVGKPGGIERRAGQRPDGSWETASWLISKDIAHEEKGRLVADSPDARKVLNQLGSRPVHVKGDIFRAKPRPRATSRKSSSRSSSRSAKSSARARK